MSDQEACRLAVQCLEFSVSHHWKLMHVSMAESEERIKEALAVLRRLANGHAT
jgi:hypothetical protein